MQLGIPEQTTELFKSKLSKYDIPDSLESTARIVCDVTKGLEYGATRAISSLILFPWPHESEELKEAGCGSRALYRFLFAHFLKERFNLNYNTVFLLVPAHASVGLFNGSEQYVIENDVLPLRKIDTSKLQLELDEVLALVERIRSQNPLEVLMLNKDTTLLRRSQNGKTCDLTARYDGHSIVFNVVLYNTPGSNIGAWVKAIAKEKDVLLQGYDYVGPGNYRKFFTFDNEKCASYNDQIYTVLNPHEHALRCIALDILYDYLLNTKRQEDPNAQTIFPEANNSSERIFTKYLENLVEKDYYSIYFRDIALDRPRTLGDYLSWNTILYNNDNFNKTDRRTRQEIDHELLVQQFEDKSTHEVIKLIQRIVKIPTYEDIIKRYFINFRRNIQYIAQEKSLEGCITRILEEFLKIHGNPELAMATSSKIMKFIFFANTTSII